MDFSAKNFIFGLGTGIVIMTLVFYCLYSFTEGKNVETQVAAALSDDEVVERAEDLGMIFIKELPEKNENPVGAPVLTDDEIITRAQELGMDFSIQEPDHIDIENTEDYIEITILPGASAMEVIGILGEKEIIQDEDAFKTLVVEKKATKKIRSGTFSFPVGVDAEGVLSIITRKVK